MDLSTFEIISLSTSIASLALIYAAHHLYYRGYQPLYALSSIHRASFIIVFLVITTCAFELSTSVSLYSILYLLVWILLYSMLFYSILFKYFYFVSFALLTCELATRQTFWLLTRLVFVGLLLLLLVIDSFACDSTSTIVLPSHYANNSKLPSTSLSSYGRLNARILCPFLQTFAVSLAIRGLEAAMLCGSFV